MVSKVPQDLEAFLVHFVRAHVVFRGLAIGSQDPTRSSPWWLKHSLANLASYRETLTNTLGLVPNPSITFAISFKGK